MKGKYRIKKSNLKEFFGFFGTKQKPSNIQRMIDSDPMLKKLDSDIEQINSKAKPYLDKMKKENPKRYKAFQDAGLIAKD
jgi:predicted RNA-binding protein Jag